jgi:hypothetical protein
MYNSLDTVKCRVRMRIGDIKEGLHMKRGVGSKEVVYQQGLLLIKGIDRAMHPAIKFH